MKPHSSRSVFGQLLLLWFASLLYGQDLLPRFESFGIEDGLVHAAVQDVLRDSSGFLWFATPGGLQRYLPHSWEVIKARRNVPQGLRTSNILRIIEDRHGAIWASTDHGLMKVDPLTLEYELRPGPDSPLSWLESRSISDMALDSENGLWLGVGGYGLVYYNPVLDDGWAYPLNGTIRGLTPLRERGRVVFILDRGDQGAVYQVIRGMEPPREVLSWGEDRGEPTTLDWRGDRLHVGFSDGLIEYYSRDFTLLGTTALPRKARITDLEVTPQGRIWVGTDKYGGMVVEPQGKVVPIPSGGGEFSISDSVVTRIYRDAEDTLWMATRNNGVSYTSPGMNRVMVLQPENQGVPVSAVHVDVRGILWVGTDGRGLYGYSQDLQQQAYFSPEVLGDSAVLSIDDSESGGLWVGTYLGGLLHLDIDSGRITRYQHNPANPRSIPANFIRDTSYDGQGRLWIASVGAGVFYLPSLLSSEFVRIDGLPLSFVALQGSDAGVYAGGPGTGVYVISSNSNMPTRITGLASLDVWDLALDEQRGLLWVATGLGLEAVTLESSQILQIDLPDALKENELRSVELDGDGGLWLSGLNRLYYYSLETGMLTEFGPESGVRTQGFSMGAGIAGDHAIRAWGGAQGLFFLSPDGMSAVQEDWAGKPAGPRDSVYRDVAVFVNGSRVPILLPQDGRPVVELEQGESSVELQIEGVDYLSRGEQRVHLRMDGVDSGWRSIASGSTVVYSHLRDGRYTLWTHVSPVAGVGPEDFDAAMGVDILVSPPFWASRWFTVVFLIFILSIPVGLVLYRARRLESFNQQLSRRVRERTEELHQSNQDLQRTVQKLRQAQDRIVRTERLGALRSLTSGIAHEMNTPAGVLITAASFLESELEAVQGQFEDNTLSRGALSQFFKAVGDTSNILQRNLVRLGRLIEEFRSVSVTEHLEMAPQRFGVVAVIRRAAQRSGYLSRGFSLDIQMPEALTVVSYETAFEELFRQLFLNTMQHGFISKKAAEGVVTITGFIQEETFFLTYQDNGAGLPPGIRRRVFDPFYTTKRIEGATGLGMYIVFNLVREVLHGDVSCEPGDGFLLQCSFQANQLEPGSSPPVPAAPRPGGPTGEAPAQDTPEAVGDPGEAPAQEAPGEPGDADQAGEPPT
ncbi:sensor histidine kinase [Spirochaeta lutea]|uniref:histidine kinase n=1 Tax=Spirochaeta lutea TaxID=1480694 RepID=A0A098QTW5_9SPIO|nr:ATP-binding protein [Spirochaeta lutea]KGE71036.1 hypothetical protein DC28_14060 [Spirochaeta lutea]